MEADDFVTVGVPSSEDERPTPSPHRRAKKEKEGKGLATVYFCAPCGKEFKTEGQWKSHERSKKHLEAVKVYQQSVEAQESQTVVDNASSPVAAAAAADNVDSTSSDDDTASVSQASLPVVEEETDDIAPESALLNALARSRTRRAARQQQKRGQQLASLACDESTDDERPVWAARRLLDMPAEVLLYILSFVPPAERVRLRRVCRTLHSTAADPALWVHVDFAAVAREHSGGLTDRLLEVLAPVCGHNIAAELQSHPAVTVKGIRALCAHAVSLRTLVLRDMPQVNDPCLGAIAKLPALRSLTLDKCIHVTTSGVSQLANMSTLEHLIYTHCNHLNLSSLLAVVSTNVRLRTIRSTWTVPSDGVPQKKVMKRLSWLRYLKVLDLGHFDSVAWQGEALKAMKHANLEILRIRVENATISLADMLRSCTALRNLCIYDNDRSISGQVISALTKTALRLEDAFFTDVNLRSSGSIAAFGNCHHLKSLILGGTVCADDSSLLALATGCPDLHTLVIGDRVMAMGTQHRVTATGLAAAALEFKSLRAFELMEADQLDEQAFGAIMAMPNLRVANMSKWSVKDISPLASHPSLVRVHLPGNCDLSPLAALPTLRSLHVHGIAPEHLKSALGLSHLERLSLDYLADSTDPALLQSCFEDELPPLSALRKLTFNTVDGIQYILAPMLLLCPNITTLRLVDYVTDEIIQRLPPRTLWSSKVERLVLQSRLRFPATIRLLGRMPCLRVLEINVFNAYDGVFDDPTVFPRLEELRFSELEYLQPARELLQRAHRVLRLSLWERFTGLMS